MNIHDVEVLKCIQSRQTKLVKEMEGNVLWWVVEDSGACLVWRKGGWRVISLLSTASWGEVEREVMVSSACYPVTRQSCTRGDPHWALGSISFPREWLNTRTDFPESWSVPQACQCSRGTWTMPLIRYFNFWSALQWWGSWTRWLLYATSNYSVNSSCSTL